MGSYGLFFLHYFSIKNQTPLGTVTFEVVTAGEGALTLTAASAGAPQLDKFDITYVDAADDSMDYTGTVTYTTGSEQPAASEDAVEGPLEFPRQRQTQFLLR